MLERVLAVAGYRRVKAITAPREAIARFAEINPDLLLLDLHMPELGGVEALREFARVKPQLILLESTSGDRDSARFVQELKGASPGVKMLVMGLLPAHEDFLALVKAGGSVLPPTNDGYPLFARGRAGFVPGQARSKSRGTHDGS